MSVYLRCEKDQITGCAGASVHSPGGTDHIRSDNSPKLTSRTVREWTTQLWIRTLFVQPGSLRRNAKPNPSCGN